MLGSRRSLGNFLFLPLRLCTLVSITREQLEDLVNTLLAEEGGAEEDEDDKDVRKFFALTLDENRVEITTTLQEAFDLTSNPSTERVLQIRYSPLAAFKVRPVTRCASSLEGKQGRALVLNGKEKKRYPSCRS